MKKKILSILLCLCMVAVLLPTTALADETLESYGYAYDVQRTQLSDNNIELWRLAAPRNSNGSAEGMQNNGSWTLTRVGTYSYMKINRKNTNNLDDIVGYVAEAYGISDKNTIVIHELKEESGTDTHIAYGVIIANDQTNGNVLFIGDSLSGSGAGYLLSTGSRNDSVTVTAGRIATDVVEQIASIALDPAEDYTFSAVSVGYGPVQPLEITVKNTGNVSADGLQVNSTDVNEEKFDLSTNTIGSIAPNETKEFTITPKTGLPAGTYTATVTVSGNNVDRQSIDVSFTVTASPSTPVVIIVPDDTADTTDPAKNPETGDNSTHLLWAVMASSALCAAALLFSSRRRGEEMQ